MSRLGDPLRHYWLVQGMARATGADLVAAFDEGRLDNAEWAEMVQTCRGCTWVDGCQDWLVAGAAGGCAAPGPCRNRARLALLWLDKEMADECAD